MIAVVGCKTHTGTVVLRALNDGPNVENEGHEAGSGNESIGGKMGGRIQPWSSLRTLTSSLPARFLYFKSGSLGIVRTEKFIVNEKENREKS